MLGNAAWRSPAICHQLSALSPRRQTGIASTAVDDGESSSSTAKKTRYGKPFLGRAPLGKQRDRLGGGLSEFVLRRMLAGQAGHSDRPVQEPRVKLAPSFVTP